MVDIYFQNANRTTIPGNLWGERESSPDNEYNEDLD